MDQALIPEPITIAERILCADYARPGLCVVHVGWVRASPRPHGMSVGKITGEGGQGRRKE